MRSTERLAAEKGASVEIEGGRHEFGSVVALQEVTLRVAGGEFLTLLGPSGSGKTTMLRIFAGLTRPTQGRVRIGGKDVTDLPPEKRDVGMVFQNYALFPHLNVLENVGFPLTIRRLPRDEVRRRVGQTLELVGLAGLGRRYPSQLSGGQQQRVAVARAIVFRPRLLLMDEPLGSLDKRLRQQLQVELRRLQREVGITTIYVTHDQDEAFAMSDRIAVMDRGRVVQIATPADIYRSPANRFVADFVGDLNHFRGQLVKSAQGTILRTSGGLHIHVAAASEGPLGATVACGIRPERVAVGRAIDRRNSYEGKLRSLTFRGRRHWAEVLLVSGESVFVELDEGTALHEGDEVQVGWDVEDMHFFGADRASSL